MNKLEGIGVLDGITALVGVSGVYYSAVEGDILFAAVSLLVLGVLLDHIRLRQERDRLQDALTQQENTPIDD